MKKWGGRPEDYLPVHEWFDESKKIIPDFRHRALRHHAEGIFLCESIFGTTIDVQVGVRCRTCGVSEKGGVLVHAAGCDNTDLEALFKKVPTRWIGEQHCMEDFGRIPTAADWLSRIEGEPWMVHNARRLSRELEGATT